MTPMSVRPASLHDIEQLVALMSEFYAESGYPLNADRSAAAFRELLDDEHLGRVWLLEAGGAIAGYLVLTMGYSMEYGGLDAFIDDLFVRPAVRNRGLGTAAVEEARAYCRARGVRAIHLEAEVGNVVAQRIYRNAGLESTDRQLLTLRLAAPTHPD